ncbi:MAG TPA: DUF4013 domain-containing protein [Pirellulales bacterium]|nr:DUF4013 domain-containing protein [Pirellulales bacterium]
MSILAPVLATEAPLDAEVVGGGAGLVQAELAGNAVDAGPIARLSYRARLRGLVRRAARLILSATDWLFGAAALVVGLSFLSTYPLLQMLSLGYLLEVSGRIARTGRLRDGFVGVRKASRLGSIAFGTWAVLLPLRFVSSVATSARLIDPGSRAARGWSVALVVLTVLAVAHIVGACWRGGRLRHFVWPRPVRLVKSIFRRGAYAKARDAVWSFLVGLRLPYYFWLGVRGFAGGLIWLFVPISLIAAGQRVPPLGFLGAVALMWVVFYLPFLQARFAAQNRFRAHFELREVRRLFRKAPVMFLLSLLCTLLFAIPLYLLKVEIVPREAAWLPSLVFVTFIFPARLLTGWSCGRAMRRPKNRNFFLRQAARLAMLPIVAFYVLIVFLTQFTSWHGVASLYEQHAFLVPVPFLGL